MTLKDFYYISQEDEPYHLIPYHTTQYHTIGPHLGSSVSKEVGGTSGKNSTQPEPLLGLLLERRGRTSVQPHRWALG